jgi:exportin-T
LLTGTPSRHNKGNLDDDAFHILRDALLSYLQSEYLYGSAEAKAPFLRNKFSHTLSLLFTATYETKWQDFFGSIFSLLRPPADSGTVPFNPHVSIFFFRLLIEISSEVADQILKNARIYNAERVVRDTRIRDRIREKDAAAINQAVLTIVAEGKQRLDAIRRDQRTESLGESQEVVDLGVRAFASYVRT